MFSTRASVFSCRHFKQSDSVIAHWVGLFFFLFGSTLSVTHHRRWTLSHKMQQRQPFYTAINSSAFLALGHFWHFISDSSSKSAIVVMRTSCLPSAGPSLGGGLLSTASLGLFFCLYTGSRIKEKVQSDFDVLSGDVDLVDIAKINCTFVHWPWDAIYRVQTFYRRIQTVWDLALLTWYTFIQLSTIRPLIHTKKYVSYSNMCSISELHSMLDDQSGFWGRSSCLRSPVNAYFW